MLIQPVTFVHLITAEPGFEGDIVSIQAMLLDPETSNEPTLFEQRARTTQRISLRHAQSIDIKNSDLNNAPELEEMLENFLTFSEPAHAWITCHGPATRKALKRTALDLGLGSSMGPPILGVEELGAVVLPSVASNVPSLATHYHLLESDPTGPKGAPSGQEEFAQVRITPALLHKLWSCLEKDLQELPLPLLSEMNWLLSRTQHPLRDLLKDVETWAVSNRFSSSASAGKLSLANCFADHSEIINRLHTPADELVEKGLPVPEAIPIDELGISALLRPEGPLAQAFPGYEDRPQQAAMAERVAMAFSKGQHLIAEAGTGVGKSLAYLVPAVLFARQNNRPVVISTHTKNLQAQLMNKDLNLLRETLGTELNAALLKGRSNYLCLRKFMFAIQESAHELDPEERSTLLPVMTWATQTRDGDVVELANFSREEHPDLWGRLHTVGEDCLARQCAFYHRCFVYKARGLARAADLVVTNHALVFADLNQESGILPPYQEIVFDEAHTLEDVATDHLACELSPKRFFRTLNKLFRASQGNQAGKGLLPSLLFQLEQARDTQQEDVYETARGHILQAIQATAPAGEASDIFFEHIRGWFEASNAPGPNGDNPNAEEFIPREKGRFNRAKPDPGTDERNTLFPGGTMVRNRGSSGGGQKFADDRRRFSAKTLRPDEIEWLNKGKSLAIAGLGRLRQALEILLEDFKELRKGGLARARELQKEISAQNLFLQELISDLEFVVKADEENYVYWIENPGRNLRLVAAPLDLSGLLHEQLFDQKRSVILTSATLSVRDAHGDEGAPLEIPLFSAGPRGPLSPPSTLTAPIHVHTGSSEPARPSQKSFLFLKQRLGLTLFGPDRLDELLEGSPFEYDRQCRLFIPTFLPAPFGARGGDDFNTELNAMTAQLVVASQGRTLVLFTSHAALGSADRYLKNALKNEQIEVLAQGRDGSREALLERLKANRRTVLLGTSSFWEGVDVPGEALSQLIITKLPFSDFTDPLMQGRCDLLEARGKDPFLHLSVPKAIIRLRQGFGRLIRSKKDKGVVVLCDKRVLTKRYGAAFLRALPCHARKAPDCERLCMEVETFLRETEIDPWVDGERSMDE